MPRASILLALAGTTLWPAAAAGAPACEGPPPHLTLTGQMQPGEPIRILVSAPPPGMRATAVAGTLTYATSPDVNIPFTTDPPTAPTVLPGWAIAPVHTTLTLNTVWHNTEGQACTTTSMTTYTIAPLEMTRADIMAVVGESRQTLQGLIVRDRYITGFHQALRTRLRLWDVRPLGPPQPGFDRLLWRWKVAVSNLANALDKASKGRGYTLQQIRRITAAQAATERAYAPLAARYRWLGQPQRARPHEAIRRAVPRGWRIVAIKWSRADPRYAYAAMHWPTGGQRRADVFYQWQGARWAPLGRPTTGPLVSCRVPITIAVELANRAPSNC